MENAARSFQFTKQIGHLSTSDKNTGDIKKTHTNAVTSTLEITCRKFISFKIN